MTNSFEHDRGHHELGPGRLPTELPYRVDALAATSALVYIWTLPRFQRALAEQIDPDPDIAVQLLARQLGMFGPQTPSALSEDLGMTRSNLSKILGRALHLGIVRRERSPHDGRSVTIVLTDEGSRLAARTLDVGDEMMRELTSDWTQGELRSWIELSRRLAVAAADYARRLDIDRSRTVRR